MTRQLEDADTTEEVTDEQLANLSAFQLELIRCLALEGATYGLGIKDWLQDNGHGEVNHGRLYPNLDSLKDAGYVEKGELDDRTNYYHLTSRGKKVAGDMAGRWNQAVDQISNRAGNDPRANYEPE